MKTRIVEIVGEHPSLEKGSKRTLPVNVCKGLIKCGMAKYVEDEVVVAKKENKELNQKSVENGKQRSEEVSRHETRSESRAESGIKTTGNKKARAKKGKK